MTDIQIDYSRPDAARCMRLLEMAGGDLDKARKLESWVTCGEIFTPVITTAPASNAGPDDLAVPAFLRKA